MWATSHALRSTPITDSTDSGAGDSLFGLVDRAGSALRHHFERVVLPGLRQDLTWRAVTVLRLVRTGQATDLARVAALSGIPKSTLTALVDTLVAQGFLKRSHHPRDRRIVRVAVTAERRRLVSRLIAAVDAEEDRLLGDLRVTERTALADLLHRMIVDLDDGLT